MNGVHIPDPGHTRGGTPLADQLVPDMRKQDSLLWRPAELGIAPGDINQVINTHLHFDHVSNNGLPKDATFFVQREHYEFAKDNRSFPNQHWNLPALSYELAALRTLPHAAGRPSSVAVFGEGPAMARAACGSPADQASGKRV
jgi:N-acyl homoserine lactone hydrolase